MDVKKIDGEIQLSYSRENETDNKQNFLSMGGKQKNVSNVKQEKLSGTVKGDWVGVSI